MSAGSLDSHIAVIGMAGRFPKSRSLEEWWQHLRDGRELVSFFTAEELVSAGVNETEVRDQRYVRASAMIGQEEIKQFDAAFFGYSPREAELMDPQQRVFLECAWHALENAGYNPSAFAGRTGIYAGQTVSTYWLHHILSNPEISDAGSGQQGSAYDFLATRIAYKLNLKGPAITLQTACSTSLVAVHMACQSLLSGECDMALAGGVSLAAAQVAGYRYDQGGILSPDGHCRVFDERAQGTIPGSGAGIVVLRRLTDAMDDRDNVLAVIRGSAVNNDGSVKVGFTAPGVDGQADVIAEALTVAGVRPESISFVEAHGTGTALGDPAEISALTKAFGASGRNGRCALASVKSNMGHLDVAAGVAGLIKTVLQLQHREIAPSLHFERANPAINFGSGPFSVNSRLSEWKTDGHPRRAGVSSFGMGGTNAHVVVEEAPQMDEGVSARPYQIILLSAKNNTALDRASYEMSEFLSHTSARLADIAWTTQVGRSAFSERRAIVCESAANAADRLPRLDPAGVFTGTASSNARPIAFLFPGQGAQYVGMGRDLYENEPVFRAAVDHCAEALKPHLGGQDLRAILYHQPEAELSQTAITQPALFATEYALAQLWKEWGITPECMIGHSIGEYVAACIAGVIGLEDAIRLVAVRGRLMQEMEPGGMLAVDLTEHEAAALAGDALSVAAVNAPRMSVLSGTLAAIAEMEDRCEAAGIDARRLRTSHAFHSRMMEPALARFEEAVRGVQFKAPEIPYLSNLTGTWISAQQVRDPQYWVQQLRSCVRFSQGMGEMLARNERILLEVGPGQSLTTLARQHTACEAGRVLVPCMRTPKEKRSDCEVIHKAIARVWVAGANLDWHQFHRDEQRRRIALPGYSFEKSKYWIDAPRNAKPAPEDSLKKNREVASWFYHPSWRRIAPAARKLGDKPLRWLLFADDLGVAEAMDRTLRETGHEVAIQKPGEEIAFAPDHVVYLAALSRPDDSLTTGFYGLVSAIQQVARNCPSNSLKLSVVTCGSQDVTGSEELNPWHSTMLGPCIVVQQEHPNLSCRVIDVTPDLLTSPDRTARVLALEAASGAQERIVAYRGGHRWASHFEPLPISDTPERPTLLRDRGVYLITGGLGNIGLELAEYLAHTCRARLILVSRSAAPSPEKTSRLESIRSLGAEVLTVAADVADRHAMRTAVEDGIAKFGTLHGVIHAAGTLRDADMSSLAEMNQDTAEPHFRTKVHGMRSVREAIADRELDFCVVLSSLSSLLGGITFGAYAAANAFLDTYVQLRNRNSSFPWITINFDSWNFGGRQDVRVGSGLIALSMSKQEGIDAFQRILGRGVGGQIAVSTGDLAARLAHWTTPRSVREDVPAAYARPELANSYAAPRNEVDRAIIRIWQRFLGVDGIGIHDNFFDLGGHSLMATKMFGQLRDTLKTELPLRDFFEASTVSELSDKIIAQEPSPGWTAKVIQVRAMVESMSEQDVAVALQGKA